MSSVGKRDVRCPHRLAFVAQPGVAQRLSHRGSVSQFRQNATAMHFDTSRTERTPARVAFRDLAAGTAALGLPSATGYAESR
jgi:hypothetical protein